MDRKDLDSPRQELSNGGLESVVTLLVRRQIDFSCADIQFQTPKFNFSSQLDFLILAIRLIYFYKWSPQLYTFLVYF